MSCGLGGVSVCCWTHTHTNAHGLKSPSTDNRTHGRCFGQCFHSQISSQDFAVLVSSRFPGSQMQLQAKRLTQTHACVYILQWRRSQLYSLWTFCFLKVKIHDGNSQWLSKLKANLKHQKQRKKTNSGHDISEGRGVCSESSFVLICVSCYPHMQMHTHYYVFA